MKKTQSILIILLLTGCTIRGPYDYLRFNYYGLDGSNWYVFAERTQGVVTDEWGPDPRVHHTLTHYELYLLTYQLNDGDANRAIEPSIKKIAEEKDIQNGFTGSVHYDESKYLPPGALFSGPPNPYPEQEWAYIDPLEKEYVDYNNDLPQMSRGLLTKEDIRNAVINEVSLESIKRIFRNNKFTLILCTDKDKVGHYIAPFVIYSVETHNIYIFPPETDNIDYTPLHSKDGDWFFREYRPGNGESVLKWNPVSGESIRWYLDLPSKDDLAKY